MIKENGAEVRLYSTKEIYPFIRHRVLVFYDILVEATY